MITLAGGVDHCRAIRHTVDAGEPIGSIEVNPACTQHLLSRAGSSHNK